MSDHLTSDSVTKGHDSSSIGTERSGVAKSFPVLRSINSLAISRGRVLGELANWAVQQSPYTVPDKLAEALTEFHAKWPHEEWGLFPTIRDLEQAITKTMALVPEILAWNQRKNGNQSPMAFVTRYSEPTPDDDFIDLDALTRNVSMACWHDAADFRSFNEDFDRRNQPQSGA